MKGLKDKFKSLRLQIGSSNEIQEDELDDLPPSPTVFSPSMRATSRSRSYAFEKRISGKQLSSAGSDSSTLFNSLSRSNTYDENPFKSTTPTNASKSFYYPSPSYQLTSPNWFTEFQDIVSDGVVQPLIHLEGRSAVDRYDPFL
jgi:hypothetical protein